ncbi:MAG TPA: hypothetical protein VER38_00990 [Candidatus Eisenbacteria bacterium]|nr:hypothetical protein [Candidatus Eisenbacteria bacterium]
MVSIPTLWLPILVSAIAVFLASWIIHMFLPYHRSDYSKVPSEDEVQGALRKFNIAPGDYMIPHCTGPEAMKSPEFKEKFQKGPVLMMTVMKSGSMNMGPSLAQWFLYTILVGVFTAYIAGRSHSPGSPTMSVFRFAGCTAFLSYSVALWQDSIWYQRKWSTTIKNTFDGLVYGLLTAAVFGWLWPK